MSQIITKPPPPPPPLPEGSEGVSEDVDQFDKDEGYLRLTEVLKKFSSSNSLNKGTTKQLASIVELHSNYFKQWYEKKLTRERISSTLVMKSRQARSSVRMRREFDEERQILVSKLNEAAALIEKYSFKIKSAKDKSRKKQEILKQLLLDKEKDLYEMQMALEEKEGVAKAYMLEYEGIAAMSDQLLEQLSGLEEQRELDKEERLKIVKTYDEKISILSKKLELSTLSPGRKVGIVDGKSDKEMVESPSSLLSSLRKKAVVAKRDNQTSSEESSDNSLRNFKDRFASISKQHERLLKYKKGKRNGSITGRIRRASSIRQVYEDSSIVVAIRIRPLGSEEENVGSKVIATSNSDGRSLVVDMDWNCEENQGLEEHDKEKLVYSYDAVFGSDIEQMIVYTLTGKHVLDRFLKGYNGTIFAYGQTGSGKTYTMMGAPGRSSVAMGDDSDGITPRLIRDTFDHLHQEEALRLSTGGSFSWTLSVTYIEIYMESIRDLLKPNQNPHGAQGGPGFSPRVSTRTRTSAVKSLSHPRTDGDSSGLASVIDIRETRSGSTLLQGAVEVNVRTYDHLITCLNEGTKRRTTETTNMNAMSSRSHSVITLKLSLVSDGATGEHETTKSKLHVVDLAGSENADATEGVSTLRRQEGVYINKSLLALHRVIKSLTEDKSGNSSKFIPYRASKLTRLLKDSLGGNCFTLMICNISPSSAAFGESRRSLNFAQSVKNVRNSIAKNIDSQTSRIRELEAENKHLKALISDYKTLMMDKVSELDPGSDGDSPPPDTYNLSVVLGEKESVQRLEVVVEEAHR